MDKATDGGPAFPQPPCPDCGTRHAPEHVPGMSLRDYFAATALPQAIEHERAQRSAMIAPGDFRYGKVAEAAYLIADAMLNARGTGPEGRG